MVRPHNTNGEELLAQAIQSINWTLLYQMDTCEEMTACFYDTVIGLIDYLINLIKRTCKFTLSNALERSREHRFAVVPLRTNDSTMRQTANIVWLQLRPF